MTWSALTFSYQEVLASSKLTLFFENFRAMADGDAGAPDIETAALANGAVDASKLGTGATFESSITRYLSFGPAGFSADDDSSPYDFFNFNYIICGDTSDVSLVYLLNLPHGATITNITAYWYRNDAIASGFCRLRSKDIPSYASQTTLLTLDSDSTAGNHLVSSGAISISLDNSTYSYFISVSLNPNDDTDDVRFHGGIVTYTIDAPLP